jgi:hypothetical protein
MNTSWERKAEAVINLTIATQIVTLNQALLMLVEPKRRQESIPLANAPNILIKIPAACIDKALDLLECKW